MQIAITTFLLEQQEIYLAPKMTVVLTALIILFSQYVCVGGGGGRACVRVCMCKIKYLMWATCLHKEIIIVKRTVSLIVYLAILRYEIRCDMIWQAI